MKRYYCWYNPKNYRLTEFVCRNIPKGTTLTDSNISSYGKRVWFFGYSTSMYHTWTNQKKKIVKIL